jgi:ketosteroid isomerase-like protein
MSVSDEATWQAVEAFGAAFASQDADAVMACMTADCLFENVAPAPDGRSYRGQEQVRRYWERYFRATPSARWEAEETFVAGDRAVQRWIYFWEGPEGPRRLRGVAIYRERDGKVAEKLSYVKGEGS